MQSFLPERFIEVRPEFGGFLGDKNAGALDPCGLGHHYTSHGRKLRFLKELEAQGQQ
ncbi:MAG: hypothetical protein HYZ72_12510 [Deltaproteobacteria bacterium]|nr:hypothetical protein [Deltaproteobacteria bacterium]